MPSNVPSSGVSNLYSHTPQQLFADLANTDTPLRVVTVNAEILSLSWRNRQYGTTISQFSHRTIDGFSLALALQLHHWLHRISEPVTRYTGATMVHDIAAVCAENHWRLALVGGDPGSAASFAQSLQAVHPQLQVCFAEHGGVIDVDGNPADLTLIQRIEATHPDVLIVGFGAPKQEQFIARHGHRLATKLLAGVGGSLNFGISKKRAPIFMQKIGFEWLYRMITEPKHWRRVIALIPALFQIYWRCLTSQLPAGGAWLSGGQ